MSNNLISYSTFLKDRKNFINSGTRSDDMGVFDTPSHNFFKILFYFYNGDSDNNDILSSGGLLAPTWEFIGEDTNYYEYNSAWAYLKNNNEEERAEKLEKFVNLLSNINCNSPWYFSEITGVEESMSRLGDDGSVKFDDQRKKITIKCLPDSYDQRIETLLNLYRDIVWSWSNKKEIVPANLRKFDMGLYIWESPVYSLNTDSVLDEKLSDYSSSYKLLEFHNCEIDYNSVKSGYSALDNRMGFSKEFSIDIHFDDCYEHSYNSIIMRTIGDVITTDTAIVIFDEDGSGQSNISSRRQGNAGAKYNSDTSSANNQLDINLNNSSNRPKNWFANPITGTYEVGPDDSKINVGYQRVLPNHRGSHETNNGLLNNIIDQAIGTGNDEINTIKNRLLLGNLYTYSISKMSDQLRSIFNGNVSTAINAIDEYAGTNIMNTIHNNSLNNLAGRTQSKLNNIVNDRKENSSNTLGNLYKSKTLINNI